MFTIQSSPLGFEGLQDQRTVNVLAEGNCGPASVGYWILHTLLSTSTPGTFHMPAINAFCDSLMAARLDISRISAVERTPVAVEFVSRWNAINWVTYTKLPQIRQKFAELFVLVENHPNAKKLLMLAISDSLRSVLDHFNKDPSYSFKTFLQNHPNSSVRQHLDASQDEVNEVAYTLDREWLSSAHLGALCHYFGLSFELTNANTQVTEDIQPLLFIADVDTPSDAPASATAQHEITPDPYNHSLGKRATAYFLRTTTNHLGGHYQPLVSADHMNIFEAAKAVVTAASIQIEPLPTEFMTASVNPDISASSMPVAGLSTSATTPGLASHTNASEVDRSCHLSKPTVAQQPSSSSHDSPSRDADSSSTLRASPRFSSVPNTTLFTAKDALKPDEMAQANQSDLIINQRFAEMKGEQAGVGRLNLLTTEQLVQAYRQLQVNQQQGYEYLTKYLVELERGPQYRDVVAFIRGQDGSCDETSLRSKVIHALARDASVRESSYAYLDDLIHQASSGLPNRSSCGAEAGRESHEASQRVGLSF